MKGPLVWDDQTGETFYVDGHLNRRRALAAVNRYVRQTCGHQGRREQLGDVAAALVAVTYVWARPNPQTPDDDETAVWCRPDHPQAEAITVVAL